MTDRRVSRPSPRTVALLAGVALGIALGAVGVSQWTVVGLGVVFVLFFIVRYRAAVAQLGRAEPGPVPCPRCDSEPRTSSGWCAGCLAVLVEHPVPASHPAQAYVAASVARDRDAMTHCVADSLTLQSPTGRRVPLTRKRFRRRVGFGLRVYRNATSRVEALYADPADPGLVWLRSYDVGPGAPGFGSIDARLVSRIRYENGLITEMIYAKALPPQPMTGLIV